MADAARQRPGDDDVPDLSSEERALRELMHHAVDRIQPGIGALPRIRQAVPRRRAARRGAWTGAAALALAVAIALPVLHEGDRLGLSGGPGSAEANGATLAAPSGSAIGGGATGSGSHPGPGGAGSAPPTGSGSASPSPGADATRPGTATPTGALGTGDGGLVPLCTRTDLGQGSAQVGSADAQGRIYGSFTVYNVSGRSCRLGGPGAVAVTGVNGTDRSKVRSADHAPGDPAGNLPAMDTEPPVLAPLAGYKVPFAWIPDQVCGSSGGASPAPTAGANQASLTTRAPAGASDAAPASGTGASAAPSSNPQASSSPTSGPTPAPSPTATPSGNPTGVPPTATIAHTPAPGSPAAATASLPVGCGGTLYRGGVQSSGGSAVQPSGTPAAG
ncbi:hypothetical protein ABTY61_19755 [Kitasatospora sp. NPDC096128]|uniref:hypothetical protein n=1 Tax=Kitasatospora sp. NPDC096128 TaxID=3155547 RepID=UPI00331CCA76